MAGSGDRQDQTGSGGDSGGATVRDRIRRIPLAERLVAGFGLVLVTGSIGLMLVEALTARPAPPALVVLAEPAQPVAGGWLVPIRVLNRGGETAAQTRVTGELRDGAALVQAGHIMFDYVPAGSERDGGLFFTRDPAGFELRVRAEGYAEP